MPVAHAFLIVPQVDIVNVVSIRIRSAGLRYSHSQGAPCRSGAVEKVSTYSVSRRKLPRRRALVFPRARPFAISFPYHFHSMPELGSIVATLVFEGEFLPP